MTAPGFFFVLFAGFVLGVVAGWLLARPDAVDRVWRWLQGPENKWRADDRPLNPTAAFRHADVTARLPAPRSVPGQVGRHVFIVRDEGA